MNRRVRVPGVITRRFDRSLGGDMMATYELLSADFQLLTAYLMFRTFDDARIHLESGRTSLSRVALEAFIGLLNAVHVDAVLGAKTLLSVYGNRLGEEGSALPVDTFVTCTADLYLSGTLRCAAGEVLRSSLVDLLTEEWCFVVEDHFVALGSEEVLHE